MTWHIILSRQAAKDAKKINQVGLKPQTEKLLKLLAENPYTVPPPYEKLVGNLQGFYSRRISLQHRLIYQIMAEKNVVYLLRMWTHYE